MIVKKILDALSLRAIGQRLDKRKLQEELDLHRLFLLTIYHHRHRHGIDMGEDAAALLDTEARDLGLDGLRSVVSSHLTEQLHDLAETLHAVLEKENDAAAATALAAQFNSTTPPSSSQTEPQIGRGGLAGLGISKPSSTASNITTLQQQQQQGEDKNKNFRRSLLLSQQQISNAFLAASGFSLNVAPSSVGHIEAGEGVFIQGKAEVGQIVALYPGVVYPPLFHRNIPGYPLVARTNPFLLSRFDGMVFDAKPWGKGSSSSSRNSSNDDDDDGEQCRKETPQNEAEAGLTHLESRNPLALGHWANHGAPNVMVAAVDWSVHSAPAHLRAYIPVVQFVKQSLLQQSHTTNKENKKRDVDEMFLPRETDPAPCVALVATRPLHDEELFLNYRLNPNAAGGLPDWYSSIDEEEDARRWS